MTLVDCKFMYLSFLDLSVLVINSYYRTHVHLLAWTTGTPTSPLFLLSPTQSSTPFLLLLIFSFLPTQARHLLSSFLLLVLLLRPSHASTPLPPPSNLLALPFHSNNPLPLFLPSFPLKKTHLPYPLLSLLIPLHFHPFHHPLTPPPHTHTRTKTQITSN